MEDCNCLVTIPIALELQAVFIESATAITVAQVVGVVVLESLLTHSASLHWDHVIFEQSVEKRKAFSVVRRIAFRLPKVKAVISRTPPTKR
jgi:hypothetical protein